VSFISGKWKLEIIEHKLTEESFNRMKRLSDVAHYEEIEVL
jgi:hypothetical protein